MISGNVQFCITIFMFTEKKICDDVIFIDVWTKQTFIAIVIKCAIPLYLQFPEVMSICWIWFGMFVLAHHMKEVRDG